MNCGKSRCFDIYIQYSNKNKKKQGLFRQNRQEKEKNERNETVPESFVFVDFFLWQWYTETDENQEKKGHDAVTYRTLKERLQNIGAQEPAEEALCLLRELLHADTASVLAYPEREYSEEVLLQALSQRASGRPLQYIVGSWPFFRETYYVNESCLIPRADTEILVQAAIEDIPQGVRFADLCTGSGCVAISILCSRKDLRADAVDVMKDALALAERNAVRNGVEQRIRFMERDVLTWTPPEPYPFVVANPPYIPDAVVETLAPEVRQEPAVALRGGEDGLRFYRSLLERKELWLRPGGAFYFEIGADQGEAVGRLAGLSGMSARLLQDYEGRDRVICLTGRDCENETGKEN